MTYLISQSELMNILQFNIDYNELRQGLYFKDGKGWNYNISSDYFTNLNNLNEGQYYNQEMKRIHMERFFNEVIKRQPELTEKLNTLWEKAHTFAQLPYYISLELNKLISLDSIRPLLFKKHLDLPHELELNRKQLLQEIIDKEPGIMVWLHNDLKRINHMDMVLFDLYVQNLNKCENILLVNGVKNQESINILLSANFKNKTKNLKRLKLLIQKDTKKEYEKEIEKSFDDDLKTNSKFRFLFKNRYDKTISNLEDLLTVTKNYQVKFKISLNDIYDYLGLTNSMQYNVLKLRFEEVFEKSFFNSFDKKQVGFNVNNMNQLFLLVQFDFKDISLENKIEEKVNHTNYYLMNLLKNFHNKGNDFLKYDTDEILKLMNIYITKNELSELFQEVSQDENILKRKNKI